MDYYKKTQHGRMLIGFCIFVAGFIYSFDGPGDEFLITLAILSGVICLFGWLTVTINKTHLKIKLGIGLLGPKIALKEIKEVKVTKIPWWLGSGVRYYRGGMFYNVSGFKAVEITQKNNKMIIRGTAEPDFLKQKIDSAK